MTAAVERERRGSVAVLTIGNPPVNALTRAVRAALLEAIAAAGADDAVEAVVIRGAAGTFVAGADIRELDRGLEPPHTPEVVAAIEASRKPVVAAIAGHALGGGLEIALACHARVAEPDARLGFPEVRLGLIPGATGTQRLPRLVGIERALDLMITGRSISASEALRLGLVDELAPAGALTAACGRARALAAGRGPLPRVRDRAVAPPERGLFDACRRKIAARARGLLAPECILRSVENAATLPFDDAARAERELFLCCLASGQSRAMRYAFFSERAAGKVSPARAAGRPAAIDTVAVVGAGTMGAGIAYSLLSRGFTVVLHDVDAERLEAGRARIEALASQAAAKGRISDERRRDLPQRLRVSGELSAAAAADLVIEAVYEDLALKRSVFAALDGVCRDGVFLASNTSTLDVDALAGATHRAQDVLGLHFFSPANVMRLVEVVRGRRTSDRAMTAGMSLVRSLGKIGVVVGNGQGFVGNRMYHCYGREAQLLLLEGASPEQVDGALCDWGMAMGPHAVGDLAGLDVGYRIRRQRLEPNDDPRYFRIADALVEAGRYGQKTGLGMYRYAAGSREPRPDPVVGELIEREARGLGIERRPIDAREIVERCLLALIVEGARVLEEGIARCASDIDVIWLNGYGFPRHRGGPMYFADRAGLDEIERRIRTLAQRHGERHWRTPRLLAELARSGRRFADLPPDTAATE